MKIVIGTTIRYLIKHKVNYCNKKSLDKLELKYGNIDREKAVKLEIFYQYLIGFEDIEMSFLNNKIRYCNNISIYYNNSIILFNQKKCVIM
ncbi:hypothetical protein [Clostridioides difficile]|uniref:hypothetical protein n=1 Tax=Clostridioides difficile TaxID=1496 RepID=UPI001F429AEA|nr:hypothetical protein [Clostridioides difficile]